MHSLCQNVAVTAMETRLGHRSVYGVRQLLIQVRTKERMAALLAA